jgi:hypothetical protein
MAARKPGGKAGKTEEAEELGFFSRAWLYLTDRDYYRKARGPTALDNKLREVNQNYLEYGPFYGFSAAEQEEIFKGAYKSSRGAIPLAEAVATIATLPFGGGATVGTKLAARLGLAGAAKATVATLVDSLGKEIAAVGVEILAGKKVDYEKRAWEVAARVGFAGLGSMAKEKLAPLLEKQFVALAGKLSRIRVAGMRGGRVETAEKAVDAEIIKQAVSSIVDCTQTVALDLYKSGFGPS